MTTKENKMGVLPIKELIIRVSLPMMISMLVQALYNVVDSIFVSQLSEQALTAVTLAFPLQNLMIALSTGTGVGVNALLSRSLGAKQFERADKAANTGIFLTFLNVLFFVFISLFVAKPFILSQTNDASIVNDATSYLRIVTGFSIGLFFQMMFERLLQSTGNSFFSMICQATGAILNIILDPILIFGLFGMPRLGVTGAAVATIIGQMVAACIGLYCNLKYNPEIHLSLSSVLSPKFDVIKRIYKVGVPSILMMAIGSFMNYFMNRILITFTSTANAVFGAYFKLQSFFFMPVFGLNSGLIPILAYNYGAQKKARIKEALLFALVVAVSIMTVGTIVMNLFPRQLLGFFNASTEMLKIGIPALHIISLHFPIAAASIVMGSIFQAFSRSIYSLIISIARQLLVLIHVAWFLAQTGNIDNVWWCFVISESISIIVSAYFFRRLYKQVVTPMPD